MPLPTPDFRPVIPALAAVLALQPASRLPAAWERHTIDNGSRGADGVRLRDVNGDGRVDIATGWEEGAITRLYLHPGPGAVRRPWPGVTVGRTPAVEDAVLVDLDGDGAIDMVSACEGEHRAVNLHWSPRDPRERLDPDAWQWQSLPAVAARSRWMFAAPAELDGRDGPDVLIGSKAPDGQVGWLQGPPRPRDTASWVYRPLTAAGWVMSLQATDLDGDGDLDALYSDRRGEHRGVTWLENPGPASVTGAWPRHAIGPEVKDDVMFLHLSPPPDRVLAVAVKPRLVLLLAPPDGDPRLPWRTTGEATWPGNAGGSAKAVVRTDLDGDGLPDLVISCEEASGSRSGVFALLGRRHGPREWLDISGSEGVKFDRLEVLDLDGDGDLDVLTCEEREGLGVIWYEQPGA